MPLCCQSIIKSIRAGGTKRTSLRRVIYPFCEPGGADSLHRLHTNRRSVGTHTPPVLLPPESARSSRSHPFPAAASAKGITHETLPAKSCATKPPVSLDSSVGQGARAPVGSPRAMGGSPLKIPAQKCNGFENVFRFIRKDSFRIGFRDVANQIVGFRMLVHVISICVIPKERMFLSYFFSTRL